ncbi:thiolase family protein [Micromonospora craniellae]|uniref:Thiolase family protein n=1 Tax=Micromonospora craniellae TaxID=2294034 RepID=A0A372G311_9ACTN|nr:thiolase family protein [Micromonospora craniellae]QOC92140.1 thiolase family protein [Micromonospora craniellae]RFS47402.1 thiolase family protein [Micromonospora craniellae]
MRDAVIVDAVRTPIGKRNGALADWHPVDLAAEVLKTLVARTGVDPADIDDVMFGCVNQLGDQSTNVGRMSALAAGWPETVPGVTIDRACGSSQQALHFAVASVLSGMADTVVAGGVEMMSRVPLGAARATGMPYGPKVRARYARDSFSQGEGAEMIAERYGLSRTALDEFSVRSHTLAAEATDAGAFTGQLVTLPELTVDEGIRRTSTVETLAGLKTAFRPDGVIHAGNSSQISDGAAALLVTTGDRARALGLTPMARFHTGTVVGDDPVVMLSAPWPATHKVLARAGLGIDDIGAFEVNEAFAPVPLGWLAETGAKPERLNPLGGAIAVGHPLGASGAILMTRLLHHMRDKGIRYGLQTMCEAGGLANATIVELAE